MPSHGFFSFFKRMDCLLHKRIDGKNVPDEWEGVCCGRTGNTPGAMKNKCGSACVRVLLRTLTDFNIFFFSFFC